MRSSGSSDVAGRGAPPERTERSVTITAACVRAIRAGRKTQLRRAVVDPEAPCPVGQSGDRLRVSGANDVRLEIVRVRLERLWSISDADLEAEGRMWTEGDRPAAESERDGFARWWDSVHSRAEFKWGENPWAWVVEFRASGT